MKSVSSSNTKAEILKAYQELLNELKQQQIESLQLKVKEQQALIDSLSSKTDYATQQVKDIALKAIENAGARQMTGHGDRPREEKKGEG